MPVGNLSHFVYKSEHARRVMKGGEWRGGEMNVSAADDVRGLRTQPRPNGAKWLFGGSVLTIIESSCDADITLLRQ